MSEPGQPVFYTFTSGPTGDGFAWNFDSPPYGDHNLPQGLPFEAPDGSGHALFENFTGNTTFFDTKHEAIGNSININQDAWWGRPIDGVGTDRVKLSFDTTLAGTIETS